MAVSSKTVSRLGLALVLVSGLWAGSAGALAPEHEMRRLMLATEEAVKAGNWGEAGEFLNRLQQLEGKKPVDYFFYRGQVMLQAGHLNEAQSALEAYVTQAGSDGSHYQAALKLITEVERARKSRAGAASQVAAGEAPKIAVIEPAGGQSIAALRQLYLADSDREALTLHLNSLLDVAGWRKDRTVVRLDKPADVSYRVATRGSTISIQEIRRESGSQVVRTTETLDVFGVNPLIEWDCESAVASCWVYDPRDGSRLLQLAMDREQARDVARTLGQLIRHLQAPNGN